MRTTATIHNPLLKLRTAGLIQSLPREARDGGHRVYGEVFWFRGDEEAAQMSLKLAAE